MGRSPCCSKEGMNRGAWTALEDKILTEFIKVHGEGRWRNLPKKAGLKRCGKSCRLRWLNYLRPDIKRGNISPDEEELIIRLHRLLGNRWSLIAGRLPGRTDNEIKNYWNTNLGKKVKDPSKSTSSLKQSEKKITPVARPAVEAPRVVRTKAIKCTKVAFLPQPLHQIEHLELAPFKTKQENKESESGNGESSFTTGDNNSPDFSMDLNNGELGLSDFLCSDFSELFNMNNAIENEFSPSSDQSLLFTDRMPVDWTGSDPVRPEIDSDLNFLTSFLISEGDYLE